MPSEHSLSIDSTDSLLRRKPTMPGYDVMELVSSQKSCAHFICFCRAKGTFHSAFFFFRKPGDTEVTSRFKTALQWQRVIEPHAGIEKVIDLQEKPEFLCAISEPLTAPTIREIVAASGAIPLDSAVEVCCQAAASIDYIKAHKAPPHCAVSPRSIRYDANTGRVLLVNYMYSSVAEPNLTPYTAPEVVAGGRAAHAADIYSVGAVLYACISGKPPFTADADAQLAARICNGPGPELASLPAHTAAVVGKLMSRSPRDRYRAAVDAINDLRGQAAAVPVAEAAPVTPCDSAAAPEAVESVPDATPAPAAPVNAACEGSEAPMSEPVPVSEPQKHPAEKVGGRIKRLFRHAAPQQDAPPASRPKRSRRKRTRSKLEVHIRKAFKISWAIGVRAAILIAVAGGSHAVYVAAQQSTALVYEEQGNPSMLIVRQKSPVFAGERIDAGPEPDVVTGAGDGITLGVGDSVMKLASSSSLQVRKLDIDDTGSRTRVFQLLAGQVSINSPGPFNPHSRFEITSAGVKALINSTRCRIATAGRSVTIQVLDGSVNVAAGGETREVQAGVEVTATSGGIGPGAAIPNRSIEAIREDTGGSDQPTAVARVEARYHRFEESKLIAPANRLLELLHSKAAPPRQARSITYSGTASATTRAD